QREREYRGVGVAGYRKVLTAVTSAGVPPNRYATSTVSLISASVAQAARLAILATPSAWAVIASTIMVIRILYLAGIAPSCRMRSRCARYDSANCASRCWRVCIHGGMVGWAISISFASIRFGGLRLLCSRVWVKPQGSPRDKENGPHSRDLGVPMSTVFPCTPMLIFQRIGVIS